MCSAPVQCHRARIPGPGVSARVSGFRAGPVLQGLRDHRGRRLLPGRLRPDRRRVRPPGPPRHRSPPPPQLRPRPGPQRRDGTGDRRLPDLPRRRRHPPPGGAPHHRRPARGDRRPRCPDVRLRADVLVGPERTQRPRGPARRGRTRLLPAGRPPRTAATPHGRLEQGVPPRVRRGRGVRLPARLLRGHPLDLPGADVRRVDRGTGRGLRLLPAAAARQHPLHHQRPALRHLRPVRPGLRVRRRPPRTLRMAAGAVPPDARPLLRGLRLPGPAPAPQPRRVLPPGHRLLPPLPHPGRPRPRRAQLRHGLMRLGARRTYRALAASRRIGDGLRRGAAALRRAVRGAALQAHYRIQLRLPLRPRDAVFAAHGGGGYACSPAAIEAKARELVPGLRTMWICRPVDAHTVPTATRRLTPGTFAYWSALARSAYLVNNVGFDRRLVKRRGQILLQTHRGTPLRTVGTDLLDRPAAAGRTDFEQLLRDVDKWDFALSANPHTTLVRERAYPSAYTTLEYGSPRNDVYHRTGPADVARLRETLGIPAGTTALLHAPTHRDYRRVQRPALDLERLIRVLGPRFVILDRAPRGRGGRGSRTRTVTTHPRIIDVTGHPSLETLALAADALLTDYSSLMFDYVNLDRPVILHLEDIEAYEAARGTYFDITAFPPGVVARSQDELFDIFATDHWRGSRSAQLRAAFRARFCPYDDGNAAERVVRRVFLGETDGLPLPVPSSARRAVVPAQHHQAGARTARG
ncbi:Putative glycosyl transferase [Streptomyces microflavus DSM 40593]|uniref:Glycosyl transferase n=1 Tax=Streptomyces microflavus DSM 40593 TaxID=1303692 RepID=N0CRM5_STRMI|nr:Putative glycosyl transferase [Streptomyces microflavus DSM 40593]